MSSEKEYIHSVWSVDSGGISVTLYPNGYVALNVEEYIQKNGNSITQDLQNQIMNYLESYKGKVLLPADGKIISENITSIIDEHYSHKTKREKKVKKINNVRKK